MLTLKCDTNEFFQVPPKSRQNQHPTQSILRVGIRKELSVLMQVNVCSKRLLWNSKVRARVLFENRPALYFCNYNEN